jgi:hypothetical protein
VWCRGRGGYAQGEVMGSNPTGRVAREFCVKNAVTCDDGDGRALAGGGLPRLKKLFAIFSNFFGSNFA